MLTEIGTKLGTKIFTELRGINGSENNYNKERWWPVLQRSRRI